MQVHWSRRLARTLIVCSCITALATAGAFASVDFGGETKTETYDLAADKDPCSDGPPTASAIPVDLMKVCGIPLEPIELDERATDFVQLGPIILQVAVSASAGNYNTSSVPTITTLIPFANFTIPVGTFPADVEILPSDPVHIYELMNTGQVTRYTTAGVATSVSVVTPPVGQTWLDMAVDPTTGIVYATAGNSTCTATTLSSINLLTGAVTPIGNVTNGACSLSLAADNSGNLFAFDIALDNILSVNKTTGAGTVLGAAGFNGQFGQGADCDAASGTCYLFAFNATSFNGELRSINTTTGATTLVGVIGQTAPGGTVQVSGAVFGTFGICAADADCNDGNACNGLETCDVGPGNCVPGTPVVCEDGQFCTLNVCDPGSGSCSFPPNPCDDGDGCTLDSCDEVADVCGHVTVPPIQFCNGGSISIPSSGASTPYPSPIVIGGLGTSASLCSVELRGIAHTFPDDIDVLLVGPSGGAQNALIMSDVGGSADVTGVNLTLTDGAATGLPDAGPLVSGTFKPTNVGTGDVFPAPAPAPAGGSALGVFSGNPNGTWNLFVVDQFTPDAGSMAQGWCLNVVVGACDVDGDCSDGNLCNGVETCSGGTCAPGTPVDCSDGDQCTFDNCDPGTGACSHPPNTCDDGDVCTSDSCDSDTGCSNIPLTPVQFCNTGSITIPNSGAGTPYPSLVSVSGMSPLAQLCSVSLNGYTHTFPDDVDVLLVGPAGGAQNAIIMSDAGGGAPGVNGVNLTLKDAAPTALPDGAPLVSGTFRPANYGTGDTFPAPAPAPAGGSALSVFAGNPNGDWNLFVVDDAGGDLGSFSGGWCVNVVLASCGSNADCDDGNACNGAETCVDTACTPGTPVVCDDGNPCTVDNCDPADGSCFPTPVDCNDGDGCTADFCDPDTGCGHVDHCIEFCNPTSIGLLDSTTPPTMASPYPSTIAVAVPPFSGVLSVANVKLNGITHTFPDDIDALLAGPTGANAIVLSDVGGGGDVTGVNLVLTDSAAASVPDGGPLVSGTFKPTNVNPGTGTEAWPAPAPAPSGGSALSVFTGTDPNGDWNLFIVDDQNIDAGTMGGGWCIDFLISCTSDADCDDGDACTVDSCVEGQCQSTTDDCDDGNPCTTDSCDSGSGCSNTPNSDPCEDGNACTTGDTCSGGSCQPGGPTDCSDSNGCTDDNCDPDSGCSNPPNNDPCDDGDFCTTGDTCGGGSCQPGGPTDCSDGDDCTADSCSDGACVNTEIDGCRCSADEPNPRTRGYWKRLCQGPHSGDELTAADAACVASRGPTFADVATVADICAVLNQGGSSCVQAEIELMSLALNVCHQFVCDSTPIDSQYSDNTTVGENYDDAEAILASGGDCVLAKQLGSEVNTGRAIAVDSVTFAKITGGGARINWHAMGGGSTPVVKYNVWRRAAGSLAPFTKIGETSSLTFDDTSPGAFEYEVTPVR